MLSARNKIKTSSNKTKVIDDDDGLLPTNIEGNKVNKFVNYASTKDSYYLSVSKYRMPKGIKSNLTHICLI